MTRILFLPHFMFCIGIWLWPNLAGAQNTAGVPGPVVNAGHKSAQYRLTILPNTPQGHTSFAQRLPYQQAFNGNFMWRVVGQTRKTEASDFDFDFVQAEITWQITPNDQDYQTGFRFDGRLRDGNRPEHVGVNWTNQWKLAETWQVRAVMQSAFQIGDRAATGAALQSRAKLSRKLDNGRSIGVEMFNIYGRTGNLGRFNEQDHTIGPFVTTPVTETIELYGGVLFGMSDAAPNTQLRIWLTRGF